MKNQKILDWYQKEIERDKVELENSKKNIINSIKTEKDLIFKQPKKISLWNKIKKVILGI